MSILIDCKSMFAKFFFPQKIKTRTLQTRNILVVCHTILHLTVLWSDRSPKERQYTNLFCFWQKMNQGGSH